MSKRFGRNQRRRLIIAAEVRERIAFEALADMRHARAETMKVRAQLAETAAALAAELGSEFRVATSEELWVIPDSNVRGFRDTTEHRRGDRMYEIERTAEVDLIQFQMTEQMVDMLDQRWRHREMVSFRGIRWSIDQMEANRIEHSGFATINSTHGMQFTVRLRAVARRAR